MDRILSMIVRQVLRSAARKGITGASRKLAQGCSDTDISVPSRHKSKHLKHSARVLRRVARF